jgi:hypothetical protein
VNIGETISHMDNWGADECAVIQITGYPEPIPTNRLWPPSIGKPDGSAMWNWRKSPNPPACCFWGIGLVGLQKSEKSLEIDFDD